MVICCTTNEKYVKFTLALINSIRKNCKINYKIKCLCVNVNKSSLQKIQNLGNVDCIVDNTKLCKKRTLTTPDKTTLTSIFNRNKDYGCLISEEGCYCSNKRFELVYRALLKNKHVLFLDVDAIVRRDLKDIILKYTNSDIAILKTINGGISISEKRLKISEPNNTIYQQGVFFVNSNDKTLRFYKELKNLVAKDMKNWNIDQVSFYNEIKNHDLNIEQLDKSFKDVYENHTGKGLNQDSYIWSGAWVDKYSNEIYKREYIKYSVI